MRTLSKYHRIEICFDDMKKISTLFADNEPQQDWPIQEGVLSIKSPTDNTSIDIYFNITNLKFEKYLPSHSNQVSAMEFTIDKDTKKPIFKGLSRHHWNYNSRAIEIAMTYLNWVTSTLTYLGDPSLTSEVPSIKLIRNLKRA